jgi:prenyl protein peptidase
VLYVAPFYVSSTTRPSATLRRDDEISIRGRIRSVTRTCIFTSLSTLGLLTYLRKDGGAVRESLHEMGLYPVGLLESLQVLLLTAILFVGPLFEAGIVEGCWRYWVRFEGFNALWKDLIVYRTLIAGPITEEILFRSCSLPILLLAYPQGQANLTTIFLLPPLLFGLAHIHHIYEFRLTHPHVPFAFALLRSLAQLTYTTLFGSFATFAYLRTGSLLAPTVSHMFCNWMGLPRFWGRLEGPIAQEGVMGADAPASGGREGEDVPLAGRITYPPPLGIAWTAAYYALLVIGAYWFYHNLWTLTKSSNALLDV